MPERELLENIIEEYVNGQFDIGLIRDAFPIARHADPPGENGELRHPELQQGFIVDESPKKPYIKKDENFKKGTIVRILNSLSMYSEKTLFASGFPRELKDFIGSTGVVTDEGDGVFVGVKLHGFESDLDAFIEKVFLEDFDLNNPPKDLLLHGDILAIENGDLSFKGIFILNRMFIDRLNHHKIYQYVAIKSSISDKSNIYLNGNIKSAGSIRRATGEELIELYYDLEKYAIENLMDIEKYDKYFPLLKHD